MEMKAS